MGAGVVLTARVLDVDVETDLSVVDRNALEGKAPIPREGDLEKVDISTPREQLERDLKGRTAVTGLLKVRLRKVNC